MQTSFIQTIVSDSDRTPLRQMQEMYSSSEYNWRQISKMVSYQSVIKLLLVRLPLLKYIRQRAKKVVLS